MMMILVILPLLHEDAIHSLVTFEGPEQDDALSFLCFFLYFLSWPFFTLHVLTLVSWPRPQVTEHADHLDHTDQIMVTGGMIFLILHGRFLHFLTSIVTYPSHWSTLCFGCLDFPLRHVFCLTDTDLPHELEQVDQDSHFVHFKLLPAKDDEW